MVNSYEIKAELLKELALEVGQVTPDLGIRAGVDSRHPIYRGKIVTSFASWDLLDLQRRREISKSIVHALEEFGGHAGIGRQSGGLTDAHTRAERRIAHFFGAESALLFGTRAQSVLTCITALCSEGWVVLGAALTTLPLADACALVGADFYEFDSDAALQALLERFQLSKRVLVFVESVSAVTGEITDVQATFSMLERCGAWGVVDESAALGIVGMRGAGSAEELPISPVLLARIVGLGLVAGVELAAIVCMNEFRELLLKRSRYLRIESPPPVTAVCGAHSALDLIEVSILQRKMISARGRLVEGAAREQGWSVLGGGDVPVMSVWFDSFKKAQLIQAALLQRSIFVEALAARSVRKTGAVLRLLLSNAHTQKEIESLIEGFAEVRKRLAADI